MKLTKEDLMKLSKERLVELLLEMQTEQETTPNVTPYIPWYPYNPPYISSPTPISSSPCWAPDGDCPNKYHDCINCPKTATGGSGTWVTTVYSNGSNLSSNLDGQFSGKAEKQTLND
jgi:hypothetical protein